VEKPQSSAHIHVSLIPPVHHHICWPKCRASILCIRQEVHKSLQKYSNPPNYIKKDISNKVICLYLKPRSSLQWIACSICLMGKWHTSSIGNNEIMSMCCLQGPKADFCLVVMSNFTSISWTFLLKRSIAKTCCALWETMSLLVKLLKSKFEIIPRRPSKAMSKSESIPLSLNIWFILTPKIGP